MEVRTLKNSDSFVVDGKYLVSKADNFQAWLAIFICIQNEQNVEFCRHYK